MISILIVHYGNYAMLQDCTKSIEAFTPLEHEILIHDNNLSENLGFSKGVNLLLAKTKNDVVLLNPDTIVRPNWLEPLVESAKGRIGIVQSRLVRPDSTIDSTGHNWRYNKLMPVVGNREVDGPIDVRTCNFACVLIRKEVIQTVGLLDPHYFMFYEDVDYCLRANQKGWKIRYCPESTVVHLSHGSTNGQPFNYPQSYNYFLRKHYPPRYLVRLSFRFYVWGKRHV